MPLQNRLGGIRFAAKELPLGIRHVNNKCRVPVSPLVTGAGAEARNSIGIILVAGMALGTLLTLAVAPELYLIVSTNRDLESDIGLDSAADQFLHAEAGPVSELELVWLPEADLVEWFRKDVALQSVDKGKIAGPPTLKITAKSA